MRIPSQVVSFTLPEALVLRGALSVAEEIIDRRRDVVDDDASPLQASQLTAIQDLDTRLDNRVEGAARVSVDPRFDEVLAPIEAQVIRDAAVALAVLVESEAGRRVLTEIGFLAGPEQPIDDTEIDMLGDIVTRIDPTGVRAPSRTA